MKRRLMATIVAGWALAASAQAPPGTDSSYQNLNVKHSDSFEYEPATGAMKLIGNVSLELLPQNPGESPLRIKAGSVSLTPSGADKAKREVVMDGGVTVDHPQGIITADRGEWKGDALVFYGEPAVVKLREGGEFRGSPLTYDMASGAFGGKNFSAVNVPLQSMGGAGGATKQAANPNAFTVQSVKDWPKFLTTLKAQAAGDAPSPGKQLVSLLPDKERAGLEKGTTNPGAGGQAQIVRMLNEALKSSKLYNEDAWKGIALDPEATELLKKAKRTPDETILLNRRLLEAAYPDVF